MFVFRKWTLFFKLINWFCCFLENLYLNIYNLFLLLWEIYIIRVVEFRTEIILTDEKLKSIFFFWILYLCNSYLLVLLTIGNEKINWKIFRGRGWRTQLRVFVCTQLYGVAHFSWHHWATRTLSRVGNEDNQYWWMCYNGLSWLTS